MGWSLAYNFNLDDEIDINEAIELRIGKDPRAGDLHCHKSCFENKSGSRLLTKKCTTKKNHFARWPSKYTMAHTNCSYQNISDSKRESMDYSQFYIRFQNFINEESKNTEPYFIDGINMEELGEFAPDFTINHTKNNPYELSQTKIHIIDENKRRRKKIGITRVEDNVATIVLRISEYTPEQLKDFKRGGIEKFEFNWNYVCEQKMKDYLLIDNKDITWEEKYSIDNPLEAKKRKKDLLDALKSHLTLRSDGIGLNASEYREYPFEKFKNKNCLSSIPFYDIIFSNEIEHDIIKKTNCKSVCIGCLDHRKKYENCSKENCNGVNSGNVNNATVTGYCSLCLEQKFQKKRVYFESSWSELYSEQHKNARWERIIRTYPEEFYNFLNEFTSSNEFGITYDKSGGIKALSIGYGQALTGTQIDDLVSKFVTSFNSSVLIASDASSLIDKPGAERLLGFPSSKKDYVKDPMKFRSSTKLQQNYGCPKCGNITGTAKNGFLNYNLDCVCDQGKISQNCDVCEGGNKNLGINELLLDFGCCGANAWKKGKYWKNRIKWDWEGNLVCSFCSNIILHREYFVKKLGKHYQLERVDEFFDLIGISVRMSSNTYEELLYARHVDDTLADWYADPEKSWSRYIASNKI